VNETSDGLAAPIAVAMRRPTLLGVPPMPVLARSLTVRRARVEDSGALAAVLGRAYPTESWGTAATERELFGDETVRATLVVEAEGRLVATASLQVRPDAPECGWLRWVATEQDRRREGLARALVIDVLAIAEQEGCREARLRTETDRVAAIALYLQLGFEPLARSAREREAWEEVIRLLGANDPPKRT
jgi:mycothiol synthase